MLWVSYVARLIALTSLVTAVPFPGSDVPGGEQTGSVSSFSIGQVPVHGNFKPRRRNPAAEYARSLARYNATIPESVTRAAAATALQSGSVPNSPEANDEEYLSPVSIGSPAQTLMLDFDTGSADLWVFSTELPSSESKGHSPLYNSAKSTTAKKLNGYSWEIVYGDNSGASGNVFSDKVVVGGVTATSQAVEAATSVSSSFTADTQNDGLLGLAFSSINTVTPKPQTTFFDTVKSTLALPVFAAYLKHQAAGVYDFGFIDSSKYTGTLAYASVNNGNGFWQFTAGSYYVGSTNEGSFGSAIADTGTSIILVDDDVIDAYYDNVQGAEESDSAGGVIFPCSSTLPSFSVTIGGVKRTTPGSYINYASIGGGYCYGGIQSNGGLSFSILGDVFLKSQYVVFDGGNTRIGFAPQS